MIINKVQKLPQEFSLFRFIKDDIAFIRKDSFSYLYLLIQLIYFSGLVKQFGTDEFLLINISFSLLLCLISKKIDSGSVVVILFSWFIFLTINIPSFFVFGVNLQLFAGYLGRILLGYLIVIYFKKYFFEKLERIITILAVISIPFYIIQLIYPNFFYLFDNISEAVLSESRADSQRSIIGHKYFFIFLLNGWGVLRNSGFMWEPAAFGGVIVWIIILNLIKSDYKVSGRFILLFCVALSTFSVGTYVALICIIIILLIGYYKTVLIKALFTVLIIIIVGIQLEIVTNNVNMMIEKIKSEGNTRTLVMNGKASETEISRVAAIGISFEYFMQWPFGYGLNVEKTDNLKYLGSSPNGMMRSLVTWGIFGLFVIIISIAKLLKHLEKKANGHLSIFQLFFLLIIFIIPMNGNPFYNQPLFFSILFGVWLVDCNAPKIYYVTHA